MRNHKQTIIKIINYTWPFLVLALIVIIGWKGFVPYFSEMKGISGVKERMSDQEVVSENPNPDDKYSIIEIQAGLKPAKVEELKLEERYLSSDEIPVGIIVSTPNELKKALSSAAPGENIVLSVGEYEMNLEIDENITIYGQGSTTILRSNEQEKAVISIQNADVTIKNLVIMDSRVGINMKKATATIEYVKFADLNSTALWAEESTLLLSNSFLYNSGQGFGTMGSSGSISRCIIKNNNKSGIELNGSGFEIKENIITSNGSYGVFVDPGSKVEMSGNYVKENKGFNIRLENKKEIYR